MAVEVQVDGVVRPGIAVQGERIGQRHRHAGGEIAADGEFGHLLGQDRQHVQFVWDDPGWDGAASRLAKGHGPGMSPSPLNRLTLLEHFHEREWAL